MYSNTELLIIVLLKSKDETRYYGLFTDPTYRNNLTQNIQRASKLHYNTFGVGSKTIKNTS